MICFSHYHSHWICGFLAICTHQYSSTWHYPAPSVWEYVCVSVCACECVFWCLSVSTVCLGAQILASVCVRAVGALRQASIIRKTDHLTQALARRLNLDPTGSSQLRALSKKVQWENSDNDNHDNLNIKACSTAPLGLWGVHTSALHCAKFRSKISLISYICCEKKTDDGSAHLLFLCSHLQSSTFAHTHAME